MNDDELRGRRREPGRYQRQEQGGERFHDATPTARARRSAPPSSATTSNAERSASVNRAGTPERKFTNTQSVLLGAEPPRRARGRRDTASRRAPAEIGDPGEERDRIAGEGRTQIVDRVGAHEPACAARHVARERPALRRRMLGRDLLHPADILMSSTWPIASIASAGTSNERTKIRGMADHGTGVLPPIPYNPPHAPPAPWQHRARLLKYGLDEFLTGHERFRAMRPMARALTFWRDTSAPRGVRLRLALEDLGPIFVKFGQMLSTRRDLIPLDIADELAQLQDRVPPFPSEKSSPRWTGSTESPSTRCSSRSIASRWPARRSRKCISRSCRTGRRSRSRCCGRTSST